MRKLGLTDWASIAEIAGMVGVMVTLVFVAVSLQHNTTAVSAQAIDQVWEASRNIDRILIQDPDLLTLTNNGLAGWQTLSPSERERYVYWVGMNIDIWEQILERHNAGLLTPEEMLGWNEYYTEFTKRKMNQEIWNEIRWWWAGAGEPVIERVEAALSDPTPRR